MKTKKILKIVALSSVLLPSLFSSVKLSKEQIFADNYINLGEEITSVYHINENFIPSSDTKIVVGGKEYKPDKIYCVYPNGDMKTGQFFNLSQYGEYTFIYEANVDGTLVSANQHLSVKKDFYYFNTSDSKLTYGDLDYSYKNEGYASGLNVDLAEGDTFFVSKPFNIYENNITNLINYKCSHRGNPIVSYMCLRITDCYNPDIYIDISVSRGSAEYECYVKTGFKGSGMVGLVADGEGLISIDGINYSINSVRNIGDGTQIPSSYKYVSESNMTINSHAFYFDNTNKEKPRIYVETNPTYQYSLVREFNNPDISNSIFPGFTNGYVYLTLTASSFNGVSTAPIQIASINGQSGSSLLPMDFYKDEIAPIINIDIPENSNTIIGGKRVYIPSASVVDDTGVKGTYSTAVYYNYQSETERRNVSVSFDENGNSYFIPNILGNYTIEYKASDVYGNVATKLLNLNASSFEKSAFDFKTNIPDNVKAGQYVSFNDYSLKSLNSLKDIYVIVTKPNGTKEEFHDLSKNYLLEQSGNYDIEYIFCDAFYSDSFTYSFIASKSIDFIFERKTIPTPNYYIAGANYSLEHEKAYIYGENGKEYIDSDCFIRFNDAEYQPFSNFTDFKVDQENVGKNMQFKFVCKENPSSYIESEPRLIVDVGYVARSSTNSEQYFYGDFTKKRESDHCSYVSNVDGENSLEYINTISMSNFDFQFSLEKENVSVNKIKIILTDYYNDEISHSITFTGDNFISIDSLDPVEMNTNWKKTGKVVGVSYTSSTSKISCANISLDLTNDFTSDLVLFKVEIDGAISDENTINIYKLCNQQFKNITNDRVSPMVSVTNPVSVASIGDTVKVYRPYVTDMLSPSSLEKCTLTVVYNGQVVTTKDGTLLSNVKNPTKDYEIDVVAYGSIVYLYTYVDGSNQKTELTFTTYIYDIIPPTLKLSTKSASQKASDYVSLISYEVTDNFSPVDKITVYFVAFNSNGDYVANCLAGKGLNIKNAGTYTVYVYAYDEAGNYAYDSYQLTLK